MGSPEPREISLEIVHLCLKLGMGSCKALVGLSQQCMLPAQSLMLRLELLELLLSLLFELR
jgi:hypothetical protein